MYVETESKIVITNDWLGKGQNLRPGGMDGKNWPFYRGGKKNAGPKNLRPLGR